MIFSQGGEYSLFHYINRLLLNFKHIFILTLPDIKFVILTSVFIAGIANALSCYLVRSLFRREYKNLSIFLLYLIDIFSLVLMLISMIYPFPPKFSNSWYIGIGTPNPWHNPTYIFARPFAILVFFYFTEIWKKYFNDENILLNLVWFSIFSFLCFWAKPSFFMAFIPTCIIYILWKCIETRGKSIKISLLLGLAFIPTAFIIYFINVTLVKISSGTNALIISPGTVINRYIKNLPLCILFAAAFPLYVFLMSLYNKILKRIEMSLSFILAFIMYIISYLEFYFLAEKGYRLYDANIEWTYLFGLFFFFLFGTGELFFINKFSESQKIFGFSLFIVHLWSGLVYLKLLLSANGLLCFI